MVIKRETTMIYFMSDLGLTFINKLSILSKLKYNANHKRYYFLMLLLKKIHFSLNMLTLSLNHRS